MVREELAISIGTAIGATLQSRPVERVHGGSINECYRWDSEAGPLFVKIAPARNIEMFAAEAAGLQELGRANAVRVPRVMGVGTSGAGGRDGEPSAGARASVATGVRHATGAQHAAGAQHAVGADATLGARASSPSGATTGAGNAWLALEWIQSRPPSGATDSLLGEQLARQHRITHESFGWSRDNTIGSTPQLNEWCSDWVAFFRERRLRYQLDLAAQNGFSGRLQRRGAVLLDHVAEFFNTYQPVPSLLHGDLWGGNRLSDERGQPVIFDPATYYGDREADLAMTRLFGGYGTGFYAAYEAAWALEAGAGIRTELYNLYHVLNHLNLFGEGYLGQAIASIDRLLAAAGR